MEMLCFFVFFLEKANSNKQTKSLSPKAYVKDSSREIWKSGYNYTDNKS